MESHLNLEQITFKLFMPSRNNRAKLISNRLLLLSLLGPLALLALGAYGDDPNKTFKSPCGSADELSARVGKCMKPIYEIIEGGSAPTKGDADMIGNCNKFNVTEKCIRTLARECLQGVHKTAVSAIASAIKRYRAIECKDEASRAKYIEPLKCIFKGGAQMSNILNNHTGIVQGINALNIPPEDKLISVCCLLESMDRSIEAKFSNSCPQNVPVMLALIHAVTEDARATLCVRPKCKGVLNRVVNHPYKKDQNIVEPVMQVVFAI